MERAAKLPERHAARVLLVNAEDRILLFHAWSDPGRRDRGLCWVSPGGGTRPGETLAETAARELGEETGLRLAPADLGPVVARCGGEWDWDGRRWLASDTFFHVKVPSLEVDVSGFEDAERRLVTGHRWWSHAELEATTELVFPFGLASLLARLLRGERPDPPVELPWRPSSEIAP